MPQILQFVANTAVTRGTGVATPFVMNEGAPDPATSISDPVLPGTVLG